MKETGTYRTTLPETRAQLASERDTRTFTERSARYSGMDRRREESRAPGVPDLGPGGNLRLASWDVQGVCPLAPRGAWGPPAGTPCTSSVPAASAGEAP